MEPTQTREGQGLCLFTWAQKGKGKTRRPQGRPGVSCQSVPLCPCPSPQMDHGFSLQEGNGFCPETTEPLSYFRFGLSHPTPLPKPQNPSPQGRLPPVCLHNPSVLSSVSSLNEEKIVVDPKVSFSPVSLLCRRGSQDLIGCLGHGLSGRALPSKLEDPPVLPKNKQKTHQLLDSFCSPPVQNHK